MYHGKGGGRVRRRQCGWAHRRSGSRAAAEVGEDKAISAMTAVME